MGKRGQNHFLTQLLTPFEIRGFAGEMPVFVTAQTYLCGMKIYRFVPPFFALFLFALFLQARKPVTPPNACVAFWNVENLFDTINDPNINDEEFLPGGKNKWTSERYNTKLQHLSKVILVMNNGNGPDILGVSEIENERVLKDLIAQPGLKEKDYGIVHYDSPDKRGIDVGFFYKKKSFRVLQSKTFAVSVEKDSFYTRDILFVKGILNKKDTVGIFVNHWPSRRGGQEASESRRMHAAQVLMNARDSILKLNPGMELLAMGDFNDEPTNNSIQSLSYKEGNAVNGFVDLMDSLKAAGDGSYHYKKEKDLIDQFLVTHSFQAKKTYYVGSARILKLDYATGVNYKDDAPGPLHTYAGSRYIGGYSDHYPIYVDIYWAN